MRPSSTKEIVSTHECDASLRDLHSECTTQIDLARYQVFFDAGDLTCRQQLEFLEAMFEIVTAFVDFEFGTHPVLHAQQEGASSNSKRQQHRDFGSND